MQILGQYAQFPRIVAIQKRFILIGDRRSGNGRIGIDHAEGSRPPLPSSSATRFSNCLIDRNKSGSFGKAVIARSQSLLSNAGLPEIADPAATSPPTPLCA